MAKYLSQLRQFKINRGNIVPGTTNEPLGHDNGAVVRKLEEISTKQQPDENSLKDYIRLLAEEFKWSCAADDDIRNCSNGLIDLVIADNSLISTAVHELTTKLRRIPGENSKIDIAGQEFESLQDLKKRLRHILVDSTVDENLKGGDYKLLLEILHHHPRLKHQEVDAIFPSVHLNPKYRGMRCFFYRGKDGKCVDFSYARCADNVKTRGYKLQQCVVNTIIELCRIFPRIVDIVADCFEALYPHYNLALEHHVSVTRAMCTIANSVPALLLPVYRLMFKKMTIIDAEIKIDDPSNFCEEKIKALRLETVKGLANQLQEGVINIEEAKERIGNREWFQEVYANIRTDEELDDMTQKLDALMAIMFEEVASVITSTMDKRCDRNRTIPEELSDSSGSDSDSDYDIDSSSVGLGSGRSELGAEPSGPSINIECKRDVGGDTTGSTMDVNTHRDFTTGTQRTKGEQPVTNGMQHITSENRHRIKSENNQGPTTVADKIVSELFDIFEDVILPTQTCKYVQFLFIHIVSLKTSWSHLFLQRLLLILYDEEAHSTRRKAASSYIASIVCHASFIQGQVVCSIVYYLYSILAKFEYLLMQCPDSAASSMTSDFTSRSRNRFGESGSVRSASQMARFYSLLQDMLHIVSYHAGVLGASPRCLKYLQDGAVSVTAFIDSHLYPVGRIREHVVDDAIAATSIVPSLRKLHISLVRAKESVFSIDSVCTKGYSTKFVEGNYPFDSFVLYHSRYFIRDKYRTQTYYEAYRDKVVVKKEFTESSVESTQGPASEDLHVPSVNHMVKMNNPNDKIDINSVIATDNKEVLSHMSSQDPRPSGKDIGTNGITSSNLHVKHDANSDCGVSENTCAMPNRSCGVPDGQTKSYSQSLEQLTPKQRVGSTSGTGPNSQTTSESTSSLAQKIKSRMERKHRRPHRTDNDLSFDFWDITYTAESSDTSEIEMLRSNSFKKLKSGTSIDSDLPSVRSPCTVSTTDTSDNKQLIVIGIDQLDDFELSLSSSILVNAPRRSNSRIFEALTSTAAYKSAIVNSEVTKNSDKHYHNSLKSFQD
ncbi:RNA polymerase I specific transcription initiation factor RRN3, putative [Babesia ovis]|uniref:RNA polymerase I specific transcription initiation factor RRN3, putative n=1 Tax=Babesia ovis TaxID=5869 RepID=A0A9W5TAY8_BABOV|nr:RNA polymerase I specific transcription initiation factor RRN3, putative [Babesia ovis]